MIDKKMGEIIMKGNMIEKLLAFLIIIILFGTGFALNLHINHYKDVDSHEKLLAQNIINEKLLLNGTWEYYPNEIIFPSRFYKTNIAEEIQVPYMLGENISFATFRKVVSISPDAELGLLNSEKNGNINVFVNKLYIHKDNMYPYYLSLQKSNKLEVVIHMQNVEGSNEFKGNIAVASYQTIYSEHENFIRLQQAIFFLLIVLGAYFILLFLLTGKNKAILLYAVFTLLMAVFTTFVGSRYVQYFVPLSENIARQVEMFLCVAMVLVYRKFIVVILKDKLVCGKYTGKIMNGAFIFSAVIVLLFGSRHFEWVSNILLGLYMLYVAMIVSKTVKFLLNRDIEGLIFISSFYLFVVCSLALVMRPFILYDMELLLFGAAVSIIIQSLYFAIELYKKLQYANTIAEDNKRMYEKVQEFNEILDQRITERTMELEELVKRDPLTELYNHPYSIRLLEESIEKSPDSVHMFMADLDNFKKINDQHGHLIGDSVIIRVSEIFGNYKDKMTFGRCGGEEFIGFARDVSFKEFETTVDSIRQELENIDFEDLDGGYFNVTISVGISTYRGQSIEKLMKEADDMLYKAKALGKNRICY